MLYTEIKTLDYFVNESGRLPLLDLLQTGSPPAFIRSARRRCFELTLGQHTDAAQVDELERAVSARRVDEGEGSYTPGEIFCLADCVLFLLFGSADEVGVRAGIVYGRETKSPLLKLNQFCERLRETLGALRNLRLPDAASPTPLPPWEARENQPAEGLTRFIARQDSDFARVARIETSRERLRAAELLEDQAVRAYLRRTEETRAEGYSPALLAAEGSKLRGTSLESLVEAGLLRREVRVSCRKTGHPLFDLPSADALALITVSRAKCSLCAASAADEVVETVYNPSPLAASLLDSGAWLAKRVYQIIRALGVPESEIAIGPTSAYGESHLIADVCGDSFLFAVRDGDLTPSLSRRIAEVVGETEASHLVILVTGEVDDESRLRVYEYAWRRARAGRDLSVLILEGVGGAEGEIERAFARAVKRRLTTSLFPLDACLGTSAGQLVINLFKLKRESKESSAGARAFTPPEPQPTTTLPMRIGVESGS